LVDAEAPVSTPDEKDFGNPLGTKTNSAFISALANTKL
jgi:hypothetical protein